jgi:superfamily II DNA or RNA helicase
LPLVAHAAPATPAEKVALFRSLFRGRDDLFPRLWINAKSGKKGYAPACSNEWVPGICDKPRVKCGECPHQAFLPVSDRVILDHLRGKHVIGVYPLLRDETCWLLAVDFDKKSWEEDLTAFAATCRDLGVPVTLERSRSGNGGHAWFFFASPVTASAARRMGCALLTETMARRRGLGLDSYDRLFPNQDTMPRGGFGNLIALPLQYGPRRLGNTVFLDDALAPLPDPWLYLASVRRVEPSVVESIGTEAAAHGGIVFARGAPSEDAEKPWDRPPSRKPRYRRVEGPLPDEVQAVLAQELFVAKECVPPLLLHRLRAIAAFENPEYWKRQNLRLSTARTPRVICCVEDRGSHIAMPRGCLDDVEFVLREHGVRLMIEDRREGGERLDVTFRGRLTAVQEQAAAALRAHDLGVFVAPPGTGKTVVGAWLVAARATSTLILVHRKPLLDQWIARLGTFLGLDRRAIGCMGGGRKRMTGRIDVALIQALVRPQAVDDLVGKYGQVIVDECHHLPAVSFERVLREVRARYVTGLTATPYRRDGHGAIIHMLCGPVRFSLDASQKHEQQRFELRLVRRETSFRPANDEGATSIQRLYAALAGDEVRNAAIIADVVAAVRGGRSPIVLTERRDHLEALVGQLAGKVRHVHVLRGGMGSRQRASVLEEMARSAPGGDRVVVATGRFIGEGFDDPRLDTLFLGLPVSWKGTLVQYAGRLHREVAGKRDVVVYDYVDGHVPMLARMFERRRRGYRAMGYREDDGAARLPFDAVPPSVKCEAAATDVGVACDAPAASQASAPD